MMWLNAVSSMAMEVKMALIASSRVNMFSGFGNSGNDIVIPPLYNNCPLLSLSLYSAT